MADRIGLYNSSTGTFFLNNNLTAGAADATFRFGPADPALKALTGNWDGLSGDGVGFYNPGTATFFLKNELSNGKADINFRFGGVSPSNKALSGNWDGIDGDGIGLYDSATGTFFLKDSLGYGKADTSFRFGSGGENWTPIVGDWDGDGDDTIGLYNTSTGTFFLKNDNVAGAADLTFNFGPASSGWTPIVGDWNGDGSDSIGLYNPATGTFFLKDINSAGAADHTFNFGGAQKAGVPMQPISGTWDFTPPTPPTPTFTIAAAATQVNEGSVLAFTVTLAEAAAVDTVVTFQLKPGNAAAIDAGTTDTNLQDFAGGAFNPVTVTILAGQTTATFNAAPINDGITEFAETFSVAATVNGVTQSQSATVLDGSVSSGQTFTLTQNVDVIPGLIGSKGTTNTSGDDLVIAGEGSLGGSHTLGSSDVINTGDGIDRMNLRLADVAAQTTTMSGQIVTPNMTSVEQVYVQALTNGTFNAINAINVTGTTEWWNERSTANLNIDNVQELATLGVVGGTGASYTVGFAPGVNTSALNVALQGARVGNFGASIENGGSEFATWNINSSGTTNSTIDALTNDNQTAFLTGMTALTATGDRMLTINSELLNTTTIDSSSQTAATAGLRVMVDDTKNITFTGGAGTDRVDVQGAGLNLNDKLDGGAGIDTFRIADGGMMSAANAINVKNFEIFEGMGAKQFYNLDNLLPNNILSEVRLNPTTNTDITVNNIPNSAVGAIRVVNDIDFATLTAKSFIQGGTSDNATLILDAAMENANNVAVRDGVNIAQLNFTRVDNLAIQSLSDGTPTTNEWNSIGNLIAGDLETITVTGDQGIFIRTADTSSAVTKVDASGMTGAVAALYVDLSQDTQGEGAQIIGTANDDTIWGTAVNAEGKGDNITAGAGNDNIVLTPTAAERNNTINYTATSLGADDVTANTVDTVWGVTTGDRINFTAGVESQLKANGYVLSAVAADQTLGLAKQFNLDNNVIVVNKGADLALQIDLNGDGQFTASQDFEMLFKDRASDNAATNPSNTITYDAVNDYFTFTNVVVPIGNIPPVAVDDDATTLMGQSVVINVLANDYDPDNGPATPLSISYVDLTPENGTVVNNGNGTITYTPKAGFVGVDAFYYGITDGANTDDGLVTVTVEDPMAPTFSLAANAAAVNEGENGAWTLNLTNAVAGQSYSVTLDAGMGGGATAAGLPGADVGALTVAGAGVTIVGNVVTFAAGTTAAAITMPFLTDAVTPEPGENVALTISGATNGASVNAAANTATVVITDVPPGAVTTVPVTAGNTVPFDASTGDYRFDFGTKATLQYMIDKFDDGDQLYFLPGNTATVINDDYADGKVDVQWAFEGSLITVQLTGLALADDASLNFTTDFNTVFGAGTIGSL